MVAYDIVFYSAGVGRTGTYMALDYLLQQAKTEGVVDVCGCVSLLREKRMDMVQMLVSIILVTFQRFKPHLPARVSNLNFHPLEVVSRYPDPQSLIGKRHAYLLNLIPKIALSSCLNTHFIPNNSDVITQHIRGLAYTFIFWVGERQLFKIRTD